MNPLNPHDIITTLGVIGVLAALFIETGRSEEHTSELQSH